MQNVNVVLGQYRAVLAAAEQMLGFAKRNAWGDVSKTAIAIGGMTGRLKSIDPETFPDENSRNERLRILTRLIDIDAQVRQLREPWAATLDEMMEPKARRRYKNPAASLGMDSD